MRLATKKSAKSFFVCLLIIFLFGSSITASAVKQVPYESYLYWEDMSGKGSRKTVYSQPSYAVSQVITASSLGLDSFSGLTDIFVSDSNIFVLDGAASKLLLLDKDYHLKKTITEFVFNGNPTSFTGARGVYSSNDKLYLCDTENGRVMVINGDGVVEYCFEKPDSPLIPKDFQYRPIRVELDSQGNVYILSEGSYYGIILFSSKHEFLGFFGANKVKTGITDVLTNIWQRIFPNNAKKSASVRALPYSIVDLYIDNFDFVYTVTGNTEDMDPKGQISKLNPGNGANIFNTEDVNFVDEGLNTTSRYVRKIILYQDLCSIDVDERGFIYALDSTYGRIFVYDENGTILATFGGGVGQGEQKGTFKMANTLALNGSDVLVCDGGDNTVTVFELTDFGTLILKAQEMTLDRKYESAYEIWNSVLEMDRNCQVAYSGLARAEFTLGDYEKALTLARKGFDRDTYSLAFKEIRRDLVDEYFWIFFTGTILAITALTVFILVSMRRKVIVIKNQELRLLSSVLVHPVNTFTTIKEKNKGSLLISGVLLLAYYVSTVLYELYGGFLFVYYDPSSFNSLWVLVKSIGIVVLWITGNWLVCSLAGGNGRIHEIIVVTCYSLIPLIINKLFQLLFTNLLTTDEAAFLSIFNAVAYILFFLMIAIGFIIIHDFSFGKFIGTSLLTVIGMAIIILLLILIMILFQQFVGFISTVVKELTMV